MSNPFKVMLATDAVHEKLRFPIVATPKLDGIRAYVKGGVVFSRANKPIPNKHVQALFSSHEHYDGELIVGAANAQDVMRQTMSGVMRVDGTPDVTLYAFDHLAHLERGWLDRITTMKSGRNVVLHTWQLVHNADALFKYEEDCVFQGYEGVILRDPDGRYKQGRSTANEGLLLKLKRFVDDEAEIIGFEERMHNGNDAVVSEVGRTKRSSHKAGKTGRGDLGALVCRTKEGVEFAIGTGFCDSERATIWADRDNYLGKYAKYKYFPVGIKEAPRHPVWLGLRSPIDM